MLTIMKKEQMELKEVIKTAILEAFAELYGASPADAVTPEAPGAGDGEAGDGSDNSGNNNNNGGNNNNNNNNNGGNTGGTTKPGGPIEPQPPIGVGGLSINNSENN